MTLEKRYARHAADLARAIDGWWKAEKKLEKTRGTRRQSVTPDDLPPNEEWALGGSEDGVGRVALATVRMLDDQRAYARLLEGVTVTEERGLGEEHQAENYVPWGFTCTATSDEEDAAPEKGSIKVEWSGMPHVWNGSVVCRPTKERDPRTEKATRWWQQKRVVVEAVVESDGRLAFMGVPDSRQHVKEERSKRKPVRAQWSREEVVRVYRNTQHAHYDEYGRVNESRILMTNILNTGPEIVRGYLRLLVVATGLELLWGMLQTGVNTKAAKGVLQHAGELEGVNGFEVKLPDRKGRNAVGLGTAWGESAQLPVQLTVRGRTSGERTTNTT